MPMSDDLASVALSSGQKSIEIAAELIKMIAPTVKQGTQMLFSTIANRSTSSGTVSQNHIIELAANAKSTIVSNSNFLQSDKNIISAKAKQYGIPVAFIGNGDKVTMSYLDRDKAAINQILQEVMQERMKEAPQSIKTFAVSSANVDTIKSEFERRGLECNFIKGADSKIYCAYKAEDTEKVAELKSNFKAEYEQVNLNCKIDTSTPENQKQIDIKADISKLEDRLNNLQPTKQTYINVSNQLKDEDFPTYSANNQKLIIEQNPDAIRVAGKAKWESLGYKVNENAKGIQILAPQADKDGKPILDNNGNPSFENIVVYDISETNAADSVLRNEKAAIQQSITELRNEYNAEKANEFAKADTKKIIFTDAEGKSVEITADKNLRKNDTVKILKDELGFSDLKAEIAANKICAELNLDTHKFNAKPSQLDTIERMAVNIKYQGDSELLNDTSFSSLTFKGSNNTHIFASRGEQNIILTPSKMTKSEMKNLCINHLGMSEKQADEAVAKTSKIDTQLNSKKRETAIFRANGESQTVSIDRTSNSSFSVLVGTKKQEYKFNDKNLLAAICKDYGITEGKAQQIIDKARKQSAFQNNISRAAKSAKEKAENLTKNLTEKVDKSKGARK